jgi:HTH-type transcriptional regulator/antitoxin HigA
MTSGIQSAEDMEHPVEPRIIKTDQQYRRFLAEVETLAAADPDPEAANGARLELLAKLVEDYEKARFPFEMPDPIDAVLFRMEQQGLKQKDIADLLGGKNRASEILARKRALTLPMIRSLYEHLDIPAALLIREPTALYGDADDQVGLDQSTVSELLTRRWVPSNGGIKEWIRNALAPAGSAGASKSTDKTKIWLWLARVREVAESRTYLSGRYKRGSLNDDAIRYLVRLSWMERGPQLAKEFLEEKGIALVVEPHLKGSRLDGAALLSRNGSPIIGLTARNDRLDNFWFTLIHECVHVSRHLGAGQLRAITDEDIEKPDEQPVAIEKEANDLAGEFLLPRGRWRRSEAYLNPSASSIRALAVELQVSPAIVAGRLRYERKNYTLFTRLTGNGEVRSAFPEVNWE